MSEVGRALSPVTAPVAAPVEVAEAPAQNRSVRIIRDPEEESTAVQKAEQMKEKIRLLKDQAKECINLVQAKKAVPINTRVDYYLEGYRHSNDDANKPGGFLERLKNSAGICLQELSENGKHHALAVNTLDSKDLEALRVSQQARVYANRFSSSQELSLEDRSKIDGIMQRLSEEISAREDAESK